MRLATALVLVACISSLPATVLATPVPADDTTAEPGSPTDTTEDQQDDVSIGWWIGGGFVAAAAVFGVAYSLRRRTGVEDWARSASLACDVGRAMSLTVSNRLDDATPWVRPSHWSEQQERFDQLLSELSPSVPGRAFPELLDAVVAADAGVVAAIDRVADGTPAETARAVLQPALDELAIALTALEEEASITVFGASLPSSRTTG